MIRCSTWGTESLESSAEVSYKVVGEDAGWSLARAGEPLGQPVCPPGVGGAKLWWSRAQEEKE